MPTTQGKEILYFTQNDHTGHLVEASHELLESTLGVVRDREGLLSQVARKDPAYITPDAVRVILARPIPYGVKRRWDQREASLGRLLYTAKVNKGPEHIDHRLDELLPSLDPEDPDSGENFLFGSRERIKYLLSERGKTRLVSLKYGFYAYIESRVLRKAVNEGVFLTQAPAA